jgi:hypothetical protein
MKTNREWIILATVALTCSCRTVVQPTSTGLGASDIVAVIQRTMPSQWSVAPSIETNAHGVVWLTLVGPEPHAIQSRMRDTTEGLRRTGIGREAVSVGISMRGQVERRSPYKWLKGLNTPVVYSKGRICVYGHRSAYVEDQQAFREVLNHASWTYGENEPLSWANWREDLRTALEGTLKEAAANKARRAPSSVER